MDKADQLLTEVMHFDKYSYARPTGSAWSDLIKRIKTHLQYSELDKKIDKLENSTKKLYDELMS